MKKFYSLTTALILMASGWLPAQTTHNVDVSDNIFTPSQLEISVGDIVVWTNSQGFHSVDGNAIDFPENPESFGNEPGAAGWTYEFVFTLPGVYNYKCGVHAAMTGSVVVSDETLGLTEVIDKEYFAIFPNPVENQLSWKWSDNAPLPYAQMIIYDLQGKKIDQFSTNSNSSYDVSSYSEGFYTLVITQDNIQIQTEKMLISR